MLSPASDVNENLLRSSAGMGLNHFSDTKDSPPSGIHSIFSGYFFPFSRFICQVVLAGFQHCLGRLPTAIHKASRIGQFFRRIRAHSRARVRTVASRR